MILNDIPLIMALLKNSRRTSINREMLGYSINRRTGPVTRQDIMSYADATLDNRERYTDPCCGAPPFYLSGLLYPMFRYYMIHPDLGLNLLRMVHAQQSASWFGSIYEGDMLDVEMTVHDVSESRAGEMVTFRTTACVNEKIVGIGDTVFIVRGREKGKGTVKPGEPSDREIFRRVIKTEENQQLKYAEVSGDGNFIHTSNFLARLAGLPRTIMHGVCIAAMASNCLLDEVLDGDMSRMKGISMRFANPVIPGEEITLVGYESGEKDSIFFNAYNCRGRAVLKNGEYTFS